MLGAAAVGLALVSLAAVPASGFERALITFARGMPGGLDDVWRLVVDALVLFALAVAGVSAWARRWALVRDLVVVFVVALLLSSAVGRLVEGSWAPVWTSLRPTGPGAWFPALRLGAPAALVLVAFPHLSQPLRQLGRWLVVLAAMAAVLLGAATPSAAVAGLCIAVMSAAAVHLAFGSCRGRPGLDDVAVALAALGVSVDELGRADRQPAGQFLVAAVDTDGEPLLVKVYGRDAQDSQLLATSWRTLWYREAGSPVSTGRRQQVEHEAFLTLLAAESGILTDRVVTAGATADGDALLVLRRVGERLADRPDRWTPAIGSAAWSTLGRLHAAGIAHGQLDDHHLIVDGAVVGLADFRGGTVAPTDERRRADEAQLLVTTALALGADVALAQMTGALGADGVAAALPFVQLTALTRHQREQLRDVDLDLDGLRASAATVAGIDPPQLQRLRRVTWRSVLQIGLLAVAFFALASAVGGFDLEQLGSQIEDASWWFIAVAVVIAQTPRPAQALSLLGASPSPMPLGPLYALQLAQSYLGLAVPTSAARVGISIRFFQRHGLAPGTALAVGALDGVAGFVVQVGLLVGILLLTPASLELHLDAGTTAALGRLILVIGVAALSVIVVVLAVGRWRRPVLAFVVNLLREAREAARGLRSWRRIGLLIGGNLGSEVLFAAALGAFAASVGYPLGLVDLLFVNISVSLLAGFLPIPGGIGVMEGGLTFALVRAGLPEESALAAVLMYRMATFYLPPVWGFFAFRWLERNQHI